MRTLSHEPDPPVPPDPVDTNTCCDDPTPGKHGNKFYCEACDTEWVPGHWLGKARQIVVEEATRQAKIWAEDDAEVLDLALAAGVKFDEAIEKHAAEKYQTLTGESLGSERPA
jgi:hypothetical protein